jgi:hypothetical protein
VVLFSPFSLLWQVLYMSFGDYDTGRKVSDVVREELAKEKMRLEPLQRSFKLGIVADDDDDGMDLVEDKPGQQVDEFPPIYFYFK